MSQTPRQLRTRDMIINAAIETWAEDGHATLAQIAEAAGIGRSTVHRYFADRNELLAAVDQECQRRFIGATERARPNDGLGLEACHRLCEEFLGLGSVLGLIFADSPLVNPDSWSSGRSSADDQAEGDVDDANDDDDEDDNDPFVAAVVRGQLDRTVNPDLPVAWAVTVLWMLLASASIYLTAQHASRRDVAALLTRTVAGAIGRPASDG